MRLCKDCRWLNKSVCYNPDFKNVVTGEPTYEHALYCRNVETICGPCAIGFDELSDSDRIVVLEHRIDGLVKLLDLHKENHNKRWWQK